MRGRVESDGRSAAARSPIGGSGVAVAQDGLGGVVAADQLSAHAIFQDASGPRDATAQTDVAVPYPSLSAAFNNPQGDPPKRQHPRGRASHCLEHDIENVRTALRSTERCLN